jgi:excisionase family DNA binding protein
MDERLIPLDSAADRLSISLRKLYRLIAERELPQPIKVGRASRLFESDIQTYLERLKSQRG